MSDILHDQPIATILADSMRIAAGTNIVPVQNISVANFKAQLNSQLTFVKPANNLSEFAATVKATAARANIGAASASDLADLDDVKADKTNVLELDNTTFYTPVLHYHPSTKKYVDDLIAALNTAVNALNNRFRRYEYTVTQSSWNIVNIAGVQRPANQIVVNLTGLGDIQKPYHVHLTQMTQTFGNIQWCVNQYNTTDFIINLIYSDYTAIVDFSGTPVDVLFYIDIIGY